MDIPPFNEFLTICEKRLSQSLNGEVKISKHTIIDDVILEKIMTIDNLKFRTELQYNLEDLKNRMNKPGFFCLIVHLDNEPIAYDFGYDEQEYGEFFSDSSATIIERKGVGSLLAILEMVYLYENRYNSVVFFSEELDQEGRPLRQIWENLGYKTVSTDPVNGILMKMDISKNEIYKKITKYFNLNELEIV